MYVYAIVRCLKLVKVVIKPVLLLPFIGCQGAYHAKVPYHA